MADVTFVLKVLMKYRDCQKKWDSIFLDLENTLGVKKGIMALCEEVYHTNAVWNLSTFSSWWDTIFYLVNIYSYMIKPQGKRDCVSQSSSASYLTCCSTQAPSPWPILFWVDKINVYKSCLHLPCPAMWRNILFSASQSQLLPACLRRALGLLYSTTAS